MFDNMKKIFEIFTIYEKFVVFIVFISPLFASLITYLASIYFTNFFQYFIIKNHNFYLTFFLFALSFLLITFVTVKSLLEYYKKKYTNKPWSLIETLIHLARERGLKKRDCVFLLCFLIGSFYFLFSSMSYMLTFDTFTDYPSIAIFASSLVLFSISIQLFYQIFVGFQEGIFARKLPFLIIMGVFSFYYFFFLLGGMILKTDRGA